MRAAWSKINLTKYCLVQFTPSRMSLFPNIKSSLNLIDFYFLDLKNEELVTLIERCLLKIIVSDHLSQQISEFELFVTNLLNH